MRHRRLLLLIIILSLHLPVCHPDPAPAKSSDFVGGARRGTWSVTVLFAGATPYPPKIKKGNPPFRRAFLIMGRITGFEPATPGTTNQCSNQLSYIRHTGGADRTRTDDPLHAMQVLYQLSYNPMRRLILYFFLPNVKSIC